MLLFFREGGLSRKDQVMQTHSPQEQNLVVNVSSPLPVEAPSSSQKDVANKPLGAPATQSAPKPPVKLVPATEVVAKPINWLWKGYIPQGGITIIAGQPGTGKTTIAIDIAARVSRGGQMPDGSMPATGTVLIWSGEDALAEVLRPRLEAASADLTKIIFVGDSGKSRFNPASDMHLLLQSIPKESAPQLFIIDPLVAAVKGDSHKNSETRSSLQPLVDFAEHTGCAVLGITHLSKGTLGMDPSERINGSIAFAALSRSVLITSSGPITENGTRKSILVRSKSNYGLTGGGFSYEILDCNLQGEREIATSKTLWGEALKGDAKTLMSSLEGYGKPTAPGALEEAKEFLLAELDGEPVSQQILQSTAKDHGVSLGTLRRAKSDLKVASKKIAGCWYWSLPEAIKQVAQE